MQILEGDQRKRHGGESTGLKPADECDWSQSMRDPRRHSATGTIRIWSRTDPEQQGAGDGTKGDCQRKAETEEPYATAEIGPQLRYADRLASANSTHTRVVSAMILT